MLRVGVAHLRERMLEVRRGIAEQLSDQMQDVVASLSAAVTGWEI